MSSLGTGAWWRSQSMTRPWTDGSDCRRRSARGGKRPTRLTASALLLSSASGDSGGPTFIDDKIAGITSYGVTLLGDDGTTSDIDYEQFEGYPNSSFGEFGGDTQVSYHASWIDTQVIPKPSALVSLRSLLGILALTVVWWRRTPV